MILSKMLEKLKSTLSKMPSWTIGATIGTVSFLLFTGLQYVTKIVLTASLVIPIVLVGSLPTLFTPHSSNFWDKNQLLGYALIFLCGATPFTVFGALIASKKLKEIGITMLLIYVGFLILFELFLRSLVGSGFDT